MIEMAKKQIPELEQRIFQLKKEIEKEKEFAKGQRSEVLFFQSMKIFDRLYILD
jgi:hypothetical protein